MGAPQTSEGDAQDGRERAWPDPPGQERAPHGTVPSKRGKKYIKIIRDAGGGGGGLILLIIGQCTESGIPRWFHVWESPVILLIGSTRVFFFFALRRAYDDPYTNFILCVLLSTHE